MRAPDEDARVAVGQDINVVSPELTESGAMAERVVANRDHCASGSLTDEIPLAPAINTKAAAAPSSYVRGPHRQECHPRRSRP